MRHYIQLYPGFGTAPDLCEDRSERHQHAFIVTQIYVYRIELRLTGCFKTATDRQILIRATKPGPHLDLNVGIQMATHYCDDVGLESFEIFAHGLYLEIAGKLQER